MEDVRALLAFTVTDRISGTPDADLDAVKLGDEGSGCRSSAGSTTGAEMKVKRIVTDIATSDPIAAKGFYGDLLGLDLLMDLGWIVTFGARTKMSVQVSFAKEGGSGAPTPDLSIEVDDLDAALSRMKRAKVAIEYGPVEEPWGVRRFFVRDPFGKLVNILAHT